MLLNTLFFVLGVSFAFFLLGFGYTALGKFFIGNRALFARVGGLIVILFGLYQLGFFGGKGFSREHRLPLRMDRFAMSPLVALVHANGSFAKAGEAIAGVGQQLE
ncbi:cytochrome c biogenesis CcdA family protein, partial [Bittarella massiliensis (ex Durand et al. 2017)]|uniref:cytochrome c biogenesis CcdA family protein n=1 Tax=Bittarella massiliensis (ex Durand et al. 2017) TaxID=1720313 RepID=UPI00349FD8D0